MAVQSPEAVAGPVSLLPARIELKEGADLPSQLGLTWLFAGVASLGVTALCAAAFSNVAGSLSSQSGSGLLLAWLILVVNFAWCLASFAAALLMLGSRTHKLPNFTAAGFGLAAAAHLVFVLLALWRMPEAARTFDLTLASLSILELAVFAAVTRERNSTRLKVETPRQKSAGVVLLAVFGISLAVAALTTVGMAASTAGKLAVPHSGHMENHAPVEPNPGQQQELKKLEHQH